MFKRFTGIFKTENRIFGLDLLRFTAIILVVMGHSRWMTASFPQMLRTILYGSGILGVELFFVLSGFLIGAILLKEFEKNGFSLNFPSIKNFYIRRWHRTLPNYYLILLVYILFFFTDKPGSIWRYFFFLQNVWNHPPHFFEESWSLCIEEISYFVTPLLLAFSARYFSKKGKGSQQHFLYASVGLIVVFTILRMIYSIYFLQSGYQWTYNLREVALIRLDAIYYGFVAAYIAAKYADFWKKISVPFFILGIGGILTLMGFQKNIVDEHPGLISNTFFFTFLSIAIACILPFLSGMESTKLKFLAKPITAVSIISYSLYLINGGLLAGAFKRYSHAGAGWVFPQAFIIYVMFWILCLSLSALIFVCYEKPMTDLRNKISPPKY